MKSILIATIGTRDLMFRIKSGEWFNIGDDRMQYGDILGEQAEVISDLGHGVITFRDLTKYLLDNLETYLEYIAPTIIGKLLTEKANEIEKVYLIATDQKSEVREREKDTLYAAELLKNWILHKFDHLNHDSVEVITLGSDGTNPANFEEMFQWWRKTWKEKIKIESSQPIWVCLKGGVGQTSEASRISGLSLFGDRIHFFEFKQNTKANRIGTPSDYSGPFLGTNYLWDRTQQQALKLLQRYDYAEVSDLLRPYFKSHNSNFGAVPNLLRAGIAWNQGQFESFLSLARSSMTVPGQIEKTFWWMAYEQAYLGTIRLQQQNTTEALLHSHRAVEGALYAWAIASFPNHVTSRQNQFPDLHKSILQIHPSLRSFFDSGATTIPLKSWALEYLLNAAIVESKNSTDFREFWQSAREIRNNLSHRLGGISEKEVFQAWGKDVVTSEQWQKRVLNCLNLISGKSFKNLAQASIFAQLHDLVMSKLKDYE
jgi:hypothetical protein